jgi:hypothetical protein
MACAEEDLNHHSQCNHTVTQGAYGLVSYS